MTGPVNFNPFLGVGGTDKVEDIKDRRQSLRFPDIDLSPIDLSMNPGQDDDGEIDLNNLDFKMNKQVPKQ